jgi:hypothetical protein
MQRLLVAGLGVLAIWLIVFVVFKFADHRVPWVVALGVTYGVAAYVILPGAVRMGLKILQRKHVPLIRSISCSSARSNSFGPPLLRQTGWRRTDWVWQARGA